MLVVVPQLMVGQTVEDVVTASERLRVAVGSRQVRIIPNDTHTGCTVRFLFADPLATVVEARFPSPNLAPTITTAEMGVTEDGQPWRLPIPVSTLTAGCTGSGKASAMWMLLLNLAPAIRSGLVQVHGVDLKGGMELGLGTRLFTRYATTPDAGRGPARGRRPGHDRPGRDPRRSREKSHRRRRLRRWSWSSSTSWRC